MALQRQLAPLVWELLSEVEALSLDASTAAQTAPFIETLQVIRGISPGLGSAQIISRNLCACRGTTRCCTPDSSRAEVVSLARF